MIATIISEKTKHYPVLLNEIISIITPQYGGTFIDCTFGQGGYTKKILEFSNTKVIGIDRDIDSKNISKNIEKEYPYYSIHIKLIIPKLLANSRNEKDFYILLELAKFRNN